MALCGGNEAGFVSTTNGRQAQDTGLTGMLTDIFPVWIRKTDTPLSVQEQLVGAVSAPILFEDMFEPQIVPDYCVSLSMQNHLHTGQGGDLYDTMQPGAPGQRMAVGAGTHSPKQIVVLVDPGAAFKITLLYDGAWFDQDLAGRIGRQLLRELRLIVDEGDAVRI